MMSTGLVIFPTQLKGRPTERFNQIAPCIGLTLEVLHETNVHIL